MAKNEHMLAVSGMTFFGQMSASSTHEIKNTLSIINESAGLLDDLSVMAQKGHPLSFERINDISKKITRQVKRTDLVVQKLNRFSHSVDHAEEIVDIEETVHFVLHLVSRLIDMQDAVFDVKAPLSPMRVTTSLFYLENAIWRAIEMACFAVQGKREIGISFGTDPKSPSIWFLMEMAKKDIMDDLFGSKKDRALLAHLDLSIEKNNENNCFGLVWPKRK